MNFKALVAAGALLATQSFAIIGIGGHYAPGFGTKMTGMKTPAPVLKDELGNDDQSVLLQHGGFDGTMQGFGFKLWIDLLPIIDIEATMNFQIGSYDATLYVLQPGSTQYTEVPLEIELGGTPFAKATPKFVAMTGDLSITYPITSLPIIRPYIGGGLSYHLNSFVLNQKFVASVVDDATAEMIRVLAETPVDPADPDCGHEFHENEYGHQHGRLRPSEWGNLCRVQQLRERDDIRELPLLLLRTVQRFYHTGFHGPDPGVHIHGSVVYFQGGGPVLKDCLLPVRFFDGGSLPDGDVHTGEHIQDATPGYAVDDSRGLPGIRRGAGGFHVCRLCEVHSAEHGGSSFH
jgi:hypothetical protein